VLQRTTIEWENIVKILDCTLESFTQDEELSAKSYSSCKTQEVLGAFLNQNWNLVAEEQVMQLIHKLKDFLIEYEEKLNPLYFYEFSYLFRSLVNTGTEKERMEIGNIYAHSFLRVDLQQEQNTKDDYIDGPFQTVHLDFGEMGRRDAAIFMVLLNCISFLDQESAELFRQWVKRLFSNDRGSKFFGDCVLTFVYYYFNGDADVSADSFAWLMYILGVLEASSNEEYLKKTVQALRNLRNLSHWTQPKNIQDLDKRKVLYEEQFVRPIYKVAKESYDIEVMKWINETEVTKNRGE
jgi:hypothetical protein